MVTRKDTHQAAKQGFIHKHLNTMVIKQETYGHLINYEIDTRKPKDVSD